jgi:hypothetical protein
VSDIVVESFDGCVSGKPPIGAKIKFKGEKQRYTVRASNTAYAICTKPFNARKTVLYTIVDNLHKVRGPENLLFGFGAETDEQCQEMLGRVTSGETEVSYRHGIPLDLEYILIKENQNDPASR